MRARQQAWAICTGLSGVDDGIRRCASWLASVETGYELWNGGVGMHTTLIAVNLRAKRRWPSRRWPSRRWPSRR
jgi:hypothetical protein